MASEAMCRGFKSLQARQSGPLAQLVEQLTLNQRVVGSIPTRPTTLARVFNLLHNLTNRFSRVCFQGGQRCVSGRIHAGKDSDMFLKIFGHDSLTFCRNHG